MRSTGQMAIARGDEPRRGQGLVEYALILLLVAIAVVVAVSAFGGALSNLYTYIAGRWPSS